MELDALLAQILTEETEKAKPSIERSSLIEDLNNMYDCWADGEDITDMLLELVEQAQEINSAEYIVESACLLWGVECDLSSDELQMQTLHNLHIALNSKR